MRTRSAGQDTNGRRHSAQRALRPFYEYLRIDIYEDNRGPSQRLEDAADRFGRARLLIEVVANMSSSYEQRRVLIAFLKAERG